MGEDVARHVADHGHVALRSRQYLRTVDGVVGRVVEVVHIVGDDEALRNIVIGSVSRRSHLYHLSELLGLLDGFLGPDAGVQVGSLLVQEVHGSHAELQAGTAAQEQHAVALGHAQNLLEQSLSLVNHSLKILVAVTDLQDGEAGAIEIEDCLSRLLNHFARQDRRSCIKVVLLHTCLI